MGLFDSIRNALDAPGGRKSAYASHILMKKRMEALLLKEQIDAGEISFSDAARKYSSCPSAGKGGSLGQFGPGQMAPAFDALVFDPDTEVGTVNVCSTTFGTHLVQVLEPDPNPNPNPSHSLEPEPFIRPRYPNPNAPRQTLTHLVKVHDMLRTCILTLTHVTHLV